MLRPLCISETLIAENFRAPLLRFFIKLHCTTDIIITTSRNQAQRQFRIAGLYRAAV
jgi:hypothetical protein